jgi:hypothetical protein
MWSLTMLSFSYSDHIKPHGQSPKHLSITYCINNISKIFTHCYHSVTVISCSQTQTGHIKLHQQFNLIRPRLLGINLKPESYKFQAKNLICFVYGNKNPFFVGHNGSLSITGRWPMESHNLFLSWGRSFGGKHLFSIFFFNTYLGCLTLNI